jgi:hypothetical protein
MNNITFKGRRICAFLAIFHHHWTHRQIQEFAWEICANNTFSVRYLTLSNYEHQLIEKMPRGTILCSTRYTILLLK